MFLKYFLALVTDKGIMLIAYAMLFVSYPSHAVCQARDGKMKMHFDEASEI